VRDRAWHLLSSSDGIARSGRPDVAVLGATQDRLQPIVSGETSGTTQLSLPVGSLTPGTTYYYKLIATTSNGALEPEGSFTTAPSPATVTPPGLPALIPYQSIAELDAKETLEDKTPHPRYHEVTDKGREAQKSTQGLQAQEEQEQTRSLRKAG
jgi:hypothetical protein